MPQQQFPFTLRALLDVTRVELQNELFAQKEDAPQDLPPLNYTSGEVLTLFHEAAMRALVRLSIGAMESKQANELVQQAIAAAAVSAKSATEYALAVPVTKPTRKFARKPKTTKRRVRR